MARRKQLWWLVALLGVFIAACGVDTDDLTGGGASDGNEIVGEKMATDPAVIMPTAAAAMGEVTSVRFELTRSGAPVFIDPAETLAIDKAIGRFAAPSSADAILTVTVNGETATQLGAIAIGDQAWLQTALTPFEPLPPSYGIDPSLFFDPKEGWQPLLESVRAVEFVGEEDRDGTTYHLRGTAPGANIKVVTAGLVANDVIIDLWVHPVSGLVRAAEFSVDFEGETTGWDLKLSEYGEPVTIEPPEDG